MKYWTKNGHKYVLNNAASVMTLLRIVIGLALIGAAFVFTPFGKLWFWVLAGLGALLLFKAYAARHVKTFIDTATQTFHCPKTGIGGHMHSFPLKNFSHFKVDVVSFALIPMGVDVWMYFIDEQGKEKKIHLRQKAYTNKTAWTQELIDETQNLLNAHA